MISFDKCFGLRQEYTLECLHMRVIKTNENRFTLIKKQIKVNAPEPGEKFTTHLAENSQSICAIACNRGLFDLRTRLPLLRDFVCACVSFMLTRKCYSQVQMSAYECFVLEQICKHARYKTTYVRKGRWPLYASP